MFVTNVFNFATEGKCYRYGSINMPINMWGPWHTATHKSEGSLADVKISVEDMISPKNVMDIFSSSRCSPLIKNIVNIKLSVVTSNLKALI